MIRACTYSSKGGRSENEDKGMVMHDDNGNFCALVADGLGGHGGGEKASAMAADTIKECFERDVLNEPEEFNVWFQMANQRVVELQTQECQMKTTLTVMMIKDNTAMWAHIGDTRLYHFINDRLTEMTFDHSVSQMAVLSGEISQDEVRFHVDRNKLLRAIGKADTVQVEISKKEDIGKDRHAFLLCSDGFWEYVLEKEMETDLKKSDTPREWIERMVKRRKKREKPDSDNNTAVAVFFEKSKR